MTKKAKKGIFITSSSLPKSVYEFVGQVEYKIDSYYLLITTHIQLESRIAYAAFEVGG